MNFNEIISNEKAVKILRNSLLTGNFNHAYLLYGSRGTGKKTLALNFAKGILCNGKIRPCDNCSSCLKVDKNIHPDLITVKKDDGKTIIPVDKIRFLREQAYILPNESKYKVIIIEDSEDMNLSSANALLKILEEPPQHIIFILTANNISSLPETIVSRCFCIETQEMSINKVRDYLIEKYINIDDDILKNAIIYSNGNIGRALQYIENETCRENFKKALNLTESLTSESEYNILKALSPFENDKEGFLELISNFDIIISKFALNSQQISSSQALRIHTLIDEMRFLINSNGSFILIQNLFCAKLKTIMEQ